jgi:hypothetical protein
MRRSAVGLYLTSLFLVLVGLTGMYFGYFWAGTVCDTSSSTCHFHAAGTVEPLPTLVGAVFFLFGVYSLVRALRPWNTRGPATHEARGEVGAALQARVARDMRVYYTKPSTRFCNPASPSEFDRQMLSLFDSIEAGADDIDTKIEALRSYVRKEGLFQRWKDQYKANMVWRKGHESLQWVAETWQLRINWARLRILGPTWGSYTIAAAWVAPAGQSAQTTAELMQ